MNLGDFKRAFQMDHQTSFIASNGSSYATIRIAS